MAAESEALQDREDRKLASNRVSCRISGKQKDNSVNFVLDSAAKNSQKSCFCCFNLSKLRNDSGLLTLFQWTFRSWLLKFLACIASTILLNLFSSTAVFWSITSNDNRQIFAICPSKSPPDHASFSHPETSKFFSHNAKSKRRFWVQFFCVDPNCSTD